MPGWISLSAGVFAALRAEPLPDLRLVTARGLAAARVHDTLNAATSGPWLPAYAGAHAESAGPNDIEHAVFGVGQTRIELAVLWSKNPKARKSDVEFVRSRLYPIVVGTVRLLNGVVQPAPEAIHMIFMPCHAKRLLPPTPGATITSSDVNGGLNFGNHVIVHRSEDACKVAVHELIHLYGLDNKLRNVVVVQREEADLVRTMNIELVDGGPLRLGLNEAYVDALACAVHAVFNAVYHDGAAADIGATLKRVNVHIQGVASRLVRHFQGSRWKEGTHAFAYYVCKAALWGRLGAFLARFPPGPDPQPQPEAFVGFLQAALRGLRLPPRTAREPRTMRMTPLV
jgi:hypothetical protein